MMKFMLIIAREKKMKSLTNVLINNLSTEKKPQIDSEPITKLHGGGLAGNPKDYKLFCSCYWINKTRKKNAIFNAIASINFWLHTERPQQQMLKHFSSFARASVETFSAFSIIFICEHFFCSSRDFFAVLFVEGKI